MNETKSRLTRCFAVLFEGLSESQIESASTNSLASWDSIAMVTLLSLVEEEFGFEIAPTDVGRLTSFEAFQEYVEARGLVA